MLIVIDSQENKSEILEIEHGNTNFNKDNTKRHSLAAPQMTSLMEKKKIRELEEVIFEQRKFISKLQQKLTHEDNDFNY